MNEIVKPMLAATIKDDLIADNMPFISQPKIDGIRAIFKDGQALSRSLKPIPNKYIQEHFRNLPLTIEGLDGELIIGLPTDPGVYNVTQSAVMSMKGEPIFRYYVFDSWNGPMIEALDRNTALEKTVKTLRAAGYHWIHWVSTNLILSLADVDKYEKIYLDQGYEGIVLRQIKAPYKYGRSTARQGYLLRRKLWEDMEATIQSFNELMSNQNEATLSERGYTVRSAHKAGKKPMNTLGALCCVCEFNGKKVSVDIGSGFDQKLRQEIWDNKKEYQGKIIKFKYTPNGSKDAPRHPIFLGFRDPIDL